MKKLILILGLLFVTFAFTSLAAGLDDVADSFHSIFGSLPNMITLDKLIGQENAALFWARFLLWILIFAVIYYGATFAFKTSEGVQKNISITVAIVFASISALLIPDPWIVGIFQTYGILAGILVWIVPVIAALFVASKIDNKLIKALFYLGMLLVLLSIDKSISAFFGQGWVDSLWYGFFRLFIAVIIILFFWYLLTGWTNGKSGDHHDSHSDNGDNWLRKLFEGDKTNEHDLTHTPDSQHHRNDTPTKESEHDKDPDSHPKDPKDKSASTDSDKKIAEDEIKKEQVKNKELDSAEIIEAKELLSTLNKFSGRKYLKTDLSQRTFKGMLLKRVIPNIISNVHRIRGLTKKKIHENQLTEDKIRKANIWMLKEKLREHVSFNRKEIHVEENINSILSKFKEFAEGLKITDGDVSEANVKIAQEYINIMRGLVKMLININLEDMSKMSS
jgi:hypothetical protein